MSKALLFYIFGGISIWFRRWPPDFDDDSSFDSSEGIALRCGWPDQLHLRYGITAMSYLTIGEAHVCW